MLLNQTLEKLRALRLEGMTEALEEQRRQSDIAELDFEERFGLLVERQWLWKANRSLAARLKKAQLKIVIPGDSKERKSNNCAPPGGSANIAIASLPDQLVSGKVT